MSAPNQEYKSGQRIECPHCGRRSTVQIKNVLDGFVLVESYPVCGLCKHRLAHQTSGDLSVPSAKKAFDRLFGSDDADDEVSALDDAKAVLSDGERHFCKDCENYVPHPFVSRCSLDNHPVDSMDDCAKFRKSENKDHESEK